MKWGKMKLPQKCEVFVKFFSWSLTQKSHKFAAPFANDGNKTKKHKHYEDKNKFIKVCLVSSSFILDELQECSQYRILPRVRRSILIICLVENVPYCTSQKPQAHNSLF